jgi:hypothetical protein
MCKDLSERSRQNGDFDENEMNVRFGLVSLFKITNRFETYQVFLT